jgi:uncharacterized protein YbjT (DUF2867 family)
MAALILAALRSAAGQPVALPPTPEPPPIARAGPIEPKPLPLPADYPPDPPPPPVVSPTF